MRDTRAGEFIFGAEAGPDLDVCGYDIRVGFGIYDYRKAFIEQPRNGPFGFIRKRQVGA